MESNFLVTHHENTLFNVSTYVERIFRFEMLIGETETKLLSRR